LEERAEQVLPGSKGGWLGEGGVGKQGGEMTQTMYAHMNISIKKKICLPYRYCFCPSCICGHNPVTYLSSWYSLQHGYWSRNSLNCKLLVATAHAHGVYHLNMFLTILNIVMAF
jgi:hypothetical protein